MKKGEKRRAGEQLLEKNNLRRLNAAAENVMINKGERRKKDAAFPILPPFLPPPDVVSIIPFLCRTQKDAEAETFSSPPTG